MRPEFTPRRDGPAKHNSENHAANPWLAARAARHATGRDAWRGNDLDAPQPFCRQARLRNFSIVSSSVSPRLIPIGASGGALEPGRPLPTLMRRGKGKGDRWEPCAKKDPAPPEVRTPARRAGGPWTAGSTPLLPRTSATTRQHQIPSSHSNRRAPMTRMAGDGFASTTPRPCVTTAGSLAPVLFISDWPQRGTRRSLVSCPWPALRPKASCSRRDRGLSPRNRLRKKQLCLSRMFFNSLRRTWQMCLRADSAVLLRIMARQDRPPQDNWLAALVPRQLELELADENKPTLKTRP